jgi:hypothetical protein
MPSMAQKKNTTISLSNAVDQSPVDKAAVIKPQRQRKVRPAAEMLVLEQRMMFDGAAMSTADLLNERNTTSSDKAAPLNRETPDLFTPQALPPQPGRLIVISAALPEANRIRLGLADKGEVVELAEGTDALSQISQLLASRSQIEELHIISHGEPGTLLLGDLRLDNSTLEARQAEILNWQVVADGQRRHPALWLRCRLRRCRPRLFANPARPDRRRCGRVERRHRQPAIRRQQHARIASGSGRCHFGLGHRASGRLGPVA